MLQWSFLLRLFADVATAFPNQLFFPRVAGQGDSAQFCLEQGVDKLLALDIKCVNQPIFAYFGKAFLVKYYGLVVNNIR